MTAGCRASEGWWWGAPRPAGLQLLCFPDKKTSLGDRADLLPSRSEQPRADEILSGPRLPLFGAGWWLLIPNGLYRCRTWAPDVGPPIARLISEKMSIHFVLLWLCRTLQTKSRLAAWNGSALTLEGQTQSGFTSGPYLGRAARSRSLPSAGIPPALES